MRWDTVLTISQIVFQVKTKSQAMVGSVVGRTNCSAMAVLGPLNFDSGVVTGQLCPSS